MSWIRTRLGRVCLFMLLATLPAFAGARFATADDGGRRSDAYREGQRALEREAWDEAARIYGKLAAGSSDETDAALYWKAYADWKRSKRKDAVEGLRRLLSSYPNSPWADDAKALELEIRDGQATSAAAESAAAVDEDLKLYALDGLMRVDSERAIPVLEKILAGDSSSRIKERALFVLSQSDSPRAREILLRVARTGQPPELRRDAVRTLGIAGEPADLAALAELARDQKVPEEVREAVVEAYLISGRTEHLVEMAKSDVSPRIRVKAIEAIGASGDASALRQLWGTERDPTIRVKLLESFGIAGDVEALTRAARDTDPRLRRKALEGLGIAGSPEAGKALRKLYGEFTDLDDRRKIAEAFMIQGDAQTLLELFHAERDPVMKKVLLQNLSVMDDPAATQVILDVLGEKP